MRHESRYPMMRMLVAAMILSWPTAALAQSSVPAVRVERHDPRFDRLLPADAQVETIADGFGWVEGPLWHREHGYLLFSDVQRNTVYRWDSDGGVQVFLERSGYTGSEPARTREPGSNGLTWDRQGRLVLCEHGDRRITRLEPDGHKTVLAERYDGRRFNSPNDLVFTSNGDLYFTDPPFGLPLTFDDPDRELPWQGVYRVSEDGTVSLLTTAVTAPNGLAFSPDERTLYVANADRHNAVWYAFPVSNDGTLGTGRVIFDATNRTSMYAGAPDGLKVDQAGHLFAVGPGGVYVLTPDGTHLGTIVTGVATSNVAWGGDGSDLYITGGSTVYRVRLATKGIGY